MALHQLGCSIAVATAASCFCAFSVAGSPQATYTGDADAIAVCRAIVKDDLPSLRVNLRPWLINLQEETHKNYRCNGMDIREFAFTQNSARTGEYLEGLYDEPRGTVSIDQVSSTQD